MPLSFTYAPNPQLRSLPALQAGVIERLAALRSLPDADDPSGGRLGRAATGVDPLAVSPPGAPGVIFVLVVEGVPGNGPATYRHLVRFERNYYDIATQSIGASDHQVVQVALVSAGRGAEAMLQALPAPRPINVVAMPAPGQPDAAQMPAYANNPMAENPYANNPMAQNPYANNPMAQNPYANNPVAENPYANAPPRPTITRSALARLLERTRAALGG